MSAESQKFKPPTPVGEPYRGDPRAAAPFESAPSQSSQAAVQVASRQVVVRTAQGSPVADAPSFRGRPGRQQSPQFERPSAREATVDERYARTAFGLGLASILVLNLILGPIAIYMGVVAVRRGHTKIGTWAISTGGAGTVIGIVVLILYLTGTIPNLLDALNGSSS